MLAAAASALLLLLVADAQGSADADTCIPSVFPNPISWEAVPIHLRHLAEDAVRVLAEALSSDLESAVSMVLRKHAELEAVAIRVNSSAQFMEIVKFRKEDEESNSTMDTFWELLDEAEANESGGWSRPFNDCSSGKWLFGYTVLLAEPLRGTAWVFLPLERLEVTQCNESFSRVFGASHSCDLKSTECIPADGSGQRAGFTCVCRPGYWRDPQVSRGIGNPRRICDQRGYHQQAAQCSYGLCGKRCKKYHIFVCPKRTRSIAFCAKNSNFQQCFSLMFTVCLINLIHL